MIKCKICSKWFKNKRGYNVHYNRMHKQIQIQREPFFDMNEMKNFITSEIQRMLKESTFNRTINNTDDLGILSIKVSKIPIFNPFESNKRLVIKDLKEQLQKGINNVLQKVGSFDDQIDFLEVSGILA